MSETAIQYRFDRKLDFRLSLIAGLLALAAGAYGVFRDLIHHDHGALGS